MRRSVGGKSTVRSAAAASVGFLSWVRTRATLRVRVRVRVKIMVGRMVKVRVRVQVKVSNMVKVRVRVRIRVRVRDWVLLGLTSARPVVCSLIIAVGGIVIRTSPFLTSEVATIPCPLPGPR